MHKQGQGASRRTRYLGCSRYEGHTTMDKPLTVGIVTYLSHPLHCDSFTGENIARAAIDILSDVAHLQENGWTRGNEVLQIDDGSAGVYLTRTFEDASDLQRWVDAHWQSLDWQEWAVLRDPVCDWLNGTQRLFGEQLY